MQVNISGIWTEVPESAYPITVPWDESKSVNPTALGDNKGCPPGYFCEYLPPGWFGGPDVRVCRRFDAEIGGGNPAVLASETGPSLYESTVINLAAAAETVVTAVTPAFTWGILGLAAVAGIMLFGRSR